MKGEPTVLIGGLPAARISDMHVCPMLNPGTPPPPHVGGPVSKGSTAVFIGKLPAARSGDMIVCSGPPDTIAMGCMTVLIGDGGGGGAGMAGSGGPAQGKGGASGATAGTEVGAGSAEGTDEDTDKESHYLHVEFVDKGGFPIVGPQFKLTTSDGHSESGMLTGIVKCSGLQPGTGTIEIKAITFAQWSKKTAKVGEAVKLKVETAGIDSGTPARLEIFIRDTNCAPRSIKTIESQVNGDKVEESWEMVVDDAFLKAQDEMLKVGGYSTPAFFFVVTAADSSMRSGLLECKDDIEINLKDKDGNAIPNKKYKLFLASGEVREGTLDGSGHAKITDVPPGRVKASFGLRQGSWNK
jgi:uncharacterized Zn-binding protein involved in type VI secretion